LPFCLVVVCGDQLVMERAVPHQAMRQGNESSLEDPVAACQRRSGDCFIGLVRQMDQLA
jgi:hypothetical protein